MCLIFLIYRCECRSLHLNRYNFLDWTLLPAPVASKWKVREELPAWTPAGANSVFFKLTGMRDWRISLWVTSKAKKGKHVDSLDWFDLNHHFRGVFPFRNIYACICFVSVFTLGIYAWFTLNTCANKDIHLHQFETRVFDFWPQLLLIQWNLFFFFC